MVAKRFDTDASQQLSAQKKRKQDTHANTSAFVTIAEGIKSGDVPSEVSQVLIDTAQIALAIDKDSRHKFHNEVVDMVGKLLSTREAALVTSVETMERETSANEQSHQVLENRLHEAQDLAEKRHGELRPAKYTLADCTNAYREAKTNLESAHDAQAQAEFAVMDAAASKLLLEDTVRELGAPLIDGSVGEDEVHGSVEKFIKILRKFSFDAAMMLALQNAISKAPGSRGPFDACVVTQFHEAVAERVRTFEATIISGQSTKENVERAVAVAKHAFDNALAKLKSMAGAFEQAQLAKEAADVSVSEAKQESRVHQRQMNKHKSELNAATAEVELFRDGPLAAFDALREFVAPPKEIDEDVSVAATCCAAQEAGA